MTFTTIHDIDAQRVTHDDAQAALREIARLCDVALTIDARASIAHNIDAQRVLHDMRKHIATYSQHVNAL